MNEDITNNIPLKGDMDELQKILDKLRHRLDILDESKTPEEIQARNEKVSKILISKGIPPYARIG